MQKLICELCGSNDFTKDDQGYFVCDYCRTKYTPEQAQSMIVEGTVRVDRSGEAASLLTLSSTALSGRNMQEAFDYANRALEIDPENATAWYLKGTAAGWLSTVQSSRFREMQHAFSLAMHHAPDDERAAMQQWCATQTMQISASVATTSLQYAQQYSSAPGVWDAHIAVCEDVLGTLEGLYRSNPAPGPLEIYVPIASDLIKGIHYGFTNAAGQTVTGVREVAPAYRTLLNQRIIWASSEIKRYNPAYVVPKPKSKSTCFVVTATTGGEHTQPVQTLREFRDTVLVEHSAGCRFIDWYYEHGPALADRIERSRLLRLASYVFVVAPATTTARIVLRRSRRRMRIDSPKM